MCMVLLPILLVASSLFYFVLFQTQWSEWFYIISLTANIGYFTNYIAIKMLFKPYQKTAFGRQGLIPKNQKKLANSMSKALIDNFLSQELWREYLFKSDVVNKVLAEAKTGSKNWLLQAENEALLTNFVIDYLQENEKSINQYIKSIQTELIGNWSEQFDPNQLLNQGFDWLENQFAENPAQMNNMIEPIVRSVAENIPQIAESLVDALDKHIEDQDTVKRGVAKIARWSTDFSADDIKRYLFRMVASFEFRETLFNGLKSLLNEYKNKPELLHIGADPTKDQLSISEIVTQLVGSNLENINWVKLLIGKLDDQRESGTIKKIDIRKILLSIHETLFEKVEHELSNGPLHTWIVDELVSMIDKLDLKNTVQKKAADFSPKKMENIFQTMISEQLVFIELLGAVLGALSGLALIDFRVFSGLALVLGSYYLLDSFFTSRRSTDISS